MDDELTPKRDFLKKLEAILASVSPAQPLPGLLNTLNTVFPLGLLMSGFRPRHPTRWRLL